MKVLLVSSDLMAQSSLEGAVRGVGGELVVTSGTQCVAQTAAQAPQWVLLDLGGNLPELAELIPQLRIAAPGVQVVAYAPHVHAAKLVAARSAGCDAVLTRGQFHASIAEVLRGGA